MSASREDLDRALSAAYAEIDDLKKRLSEVEKDAARYQFLRSQPLDLSEPFWIQVSREDEFDSKRWGLNGEYADHFLDLARLKRPRPAGSARTLSASASAPGKWSIAPTATPTHAGGSNRGNAR